MNDATPGTFAAPLLLEEIRGHVPADLLHWCDLANDAAWHVCHERNSCILTSHALAAYLRLMGREPWLVRIEAHTFIKCRCATDCYGRNCAGGTGLGSRGDGTRRPAAGPGNWRGHLAVACDGHLLDPTIDQADTDLACFRPMVFPLPQWWDAGNCIFFVDEDGNTLRYNKYHRQVGWKSAPDARPSRWGIVTDLMLSVKVARP